GIAGEPTTWSGRVLEASIILAPLLIALVLLLLVRGALGLLGMHTEVVETALQLTTALALVRLGVYLLRLLLGAESWLRAWENRIAIILWLMIGFELVGWFNAAESTL